MSIPSSFGLFRPVSGGQARFRQIVEMFSSPGDRVVVLQPSCFRDPKDTTVAEVRYFRELTLGNKLLTIFRDLNPWFAWRLAQLVRRVSPDVLEFSHPSGMVVAKVVLRLLGVEAVLVYCAQNVESEFVEQVLSMNPAYGRLARLVVQLYVRFLEAYVAKCIAAHIVTISEKDKNSFIARYRLRADAVTTIELSCTRRVKRDPATRETMRRSLGVASNDLVVLFLGALLHKPNQDAIRLIESYIAPRVLNREKSALFVIAGSGVPTTRKGRVYFVGYVENLEDLLAASDIAIAPVVSGTGVKLKVRDYICAGLPIVATRKAVEGIEAEDGKHARVVGDVNSEFVQALLALLSDPKERLRMAQGAIELAEKNYDWQTNALRIHQLYSRLLAREYLPPIPFS